MIRKLTLAAVLAVTATTAFAQVEDEIEDYDFSFEGPFGAFDQNQLQRGLQIYTESCAACHGLAQVSFRNLSDKGGPALPEEQMRAYAKEFEVYDQSLNDGMGDFRPATPADKFPGSSNPDIPDLSLMAKARAGFHGPYGTGLNQLFKGMGGPEYIASLVAGFEEPPECAPEDFSGNYNIAFPSGGYPEECISEDGEYLVPGSWIAMGQPLYGEDFDFEDGSPNDLKSEAEDVAAFLTWTAEPKLMARKQAGLTGVLFLSVLSVLLYLTNKRLWAPHKRKKED